MAEEISVPVVEDEDPDEAVKGTVPDTDSHEQSPMPSSEWSLLSDELESCKFKNQDAADDLRCIQCKFLPRDPYQLTCQGQEGVSIICESCINIERCVRCNRRRCRPFRDRRLQRDIGRLEVYCFHRNDGCPWEGLYVDVGDHNLECMYRLVRCSNGCGQRVPRRDSESHMADQCPSRMSVCELCGTEGTHAFIVSEHIDECPGVEVGCENQRCNSVVTRQDVAEHRRNCPMKTVNCPYRDFGCDQTIILQELPDHMDDKVSVHLEMVTQRLQGIVRPIKLSDFTRHVRRGERNWLSDGFYTGIGGYHMQLCVKIMNGGRDTTPPYLSVYINILPGVNDDNVDWPFRGKVTVMLLNQLEDHNHKVRHIMVDEHVPNECTRRKVKNDEIFCGHEKFIEESDLENNEERHTHYLKNDGLYFRVIVEIESETKPWLAMNAII